MPTNDPRIDAYIAKAEPFAQPILEYIRGRIHVLVPVVEEAMKWNHPTYLLDGKILLGTAAFKAHAAINFWRGKELGIEQSEDAMGQFGKLSSLDDLPANLDTLILQAAALNAAGPSPKKPKAPPKPVGELHPDFVKALAANAKAKAAFDAFAPSHRREYVEWIGEAKRDETRGNRIAQTIEWLSEGKKRNWKYEGC